MESERLGKFGSFRLLRNCLRQTAEANLKIHQHRGVIDLEGSLPINYHVSVTSAKLCDLRSEESRNKSAFESSADVWEQNLSNSFNIDASTEGLQKVQLKCGADSMQIELVTNDAFTGVIYTRGSFYKQKAPCFMEGRGARSLTMKFPLGQCQTLQEGDVFSNVVVVQHDPELVTTGDAAFQVECDFRKPRSITVNADLQAKDAR